MTATVTTGFKTTFAARSRCSLTRQIPELSALAVALSRRARVKQWNCSGRPSRPWPLIRTAMLVRQSSNLRATCHQPRHRTILRATSSASGMVKMILFGGTSNVELRKCHLISTIRQRKSSDVGNTTRAATSKMTFYEETSMISLERPGFLQPSFTSKVDCCISWRKT